MDKLATWKIRPNQYDQWQCLHKEYPRDKTYGCEFNTLTYLDSLPRDVGEYLTRDTNLKPVKEAATQERVLGLLREYFPNHYEDTIPRWSFIDRPFISGTWNEVLRNMDPGEATFLWLVRKEPSPSHAVVLYKGATPPSKPHTNTEHKGDADGHLSIVDAQQMKIRKFGGFEQWFKKLEVTALRFLVSSESKKRAYPRYGPFRKWVSEEPLAKRRRTSRSKSRDSASKSRSKSKSLPKTPSPVASFRVGTTASKTLKKHKRKYT
jgi:hypothetical protein